MNKSALKIGIIYMAVFCFVCTQNKMLAQISSDSTLDKFLSILPQQDPIPVAYLGSYHMSNPGADQFNLESDDVLLPKRQAEIQEVVQLLKAFNPTKIAIESPLHDSTTLARYQSYLKGELELRRSEEEQIGFRLAKMLGHEKIYPIDVKMGLDNSGVSQLIGANPAKFGPYMADMEKAGNAAMAIMGEWLQTGTIREMLMHMNDPKLDDLNLGLYFQTFVPIVEDHQYGGADMVSIWYHRNLRIFSNLHLINDQPEDRILVIFGQGHIPLLKHYTQMSPYFEAVDVRQFLEK